MPVFVLFVRLFYPGNLFFDQNNSTKTQQLAASLTWVG